MEDKDEVITEIHHPDILWYMKDGNFHVSFLGKSLPFAELDEDDFEDGLARVLSAFTTTFLLAEDRMNIDFERVLDLYDKYTEAPVQRLKDIDKATRLSRFIVEESNIPFEEKKELVKSLVESSCLGDFFDVEELF